MLSVLKTILFVLVGLLMLPFFADDLSGKSFGLLTGVAMAESCSTAECHAAIGNARFAHVPVAAGDCMDCHAEAGKPHPGQGSMVLVEEEPGLCLQCHESPSAGMEYPHSAVEESCTGCHDPHQSEYPKLVLQQGGELCLNCHEVVMDGEYAHGPVRANNCKMCHGVHGGQHESMLTLPGKEICFACHGGIREIIENAKSQHDPVANGLCWDCHAPHTADFEPFLEGPYPEGFYTSFDEKKYELCFNCHSETAFTYWLTSEATRFRNHNSNLHSFHVNRMDKGRVCKACHGVHGTDQGKLLYSRVPNFGQWEIPLQWVVSQNGDGATCYVGCHKPKRYDREQWIRNK